MTKSLRVHAPDFAPVLNFCPAKRVAVDYSLAYTHLLMKGLVPPCGMQWPVMGLETNHQSKCFKEMKFRHIICVALVLSGGLLGCSQIARADQTNAPASTNSVRHSQPCPKRFLGFFDKGNYAGYVILEDVSNIQDDANNLLFEVMVGTSFSEETKLGRNPLRVWLLATNGTALPADGIGGICDPAGTLATYLFKKTQGMDQLYGVVVEYDGRAKVFTMPLTFTNISARSQFYFDELASYSADTLNKFESGHLKGEKQDEAEKIIEMGITDIKKLLHDDKVNLIWDRQKKIYQLQ
jgi:hypothetical protein